MKKINLLFLVLLGFSFQNLKAQELSLGEKAIVKWIDQNHTAALKLLEESANINSGSLNITGVKKVGAIYARELEKAGFTCTWISMPDSIKRAGHLVATRKGRKGKKLFLIGHLDTVFEPDMPFTPFTMINDSTATGQGVNDMKGGDVIMIKALQALHAQGLLDDVTITAYFTGDEERGGDPVSVSRGDFIERAKQHDIAIGFEGASGLNTIATARRGSSGWTLSVTAKTGHSSGIFKPSVGYGAIYEAARIINEFRLQLSTEQYLTFNPGLFIGGSEMSYDPNKAAGNAIGKDNIISPAVTVTGDLRFLTEQQKENAREVMRKIVTQNLSETKATIVFEDGIPSMAPTGGNANVLKVIDGISKDLGMGETKAGDPGSRGAGDISYVAAYLDCVDGLGASGKGAHAPGETINLKDLPYLTKRAALLMHRLTR
ncbi:MAG: M20/M25/M40 family metallo-hydrolase [Chitinophagia bacterium]|jgi:glutamate carboxypeptidase